MNPHIDTERYPIDAPQSDAYRVFIEHCQQQLARTGALALSGFLTANIVRRLVKHSEIAKFTGHRMNG